MQAGNALTPESKKAITACMDEALEDGIFPGAVLTVVSRGMTVFHEAFGHADLASGRKMTLDTVFDLASLTKPLATTPAIMALVQQSAIHLDQPLGGILPRFKNTPKAVVTVRQLLSHTAGLAAYRPYFKQLAKLPTEQRPSALETLLVEEPLVSAPGSETRYSDLGFMILSWIVEAVTHRRLNDFVEQQLYAGMGIFDLYYIAGKQRVRSGRFAATERCAWRGRLVVGEVHDENASVMGGVAGHAGLFGRAEAVKRLLLLLSGAAKGEAALPSISPEVLQTFFRRQPGTGRALGFDTPSNQGSSCGRFFSPRTVGHLGFSGTSFWIDLTRDIIVILLTNRIHPTRSNKKIRHFRPKIHNLVMSSLTGQSRALPS